MCSNYLAVWSHCNAALIVNLCAVSWVVIWEDLSSVDWQGLPGARGSPPPPPRCWIVIVGVEVDFKDLLQFLSEIYCHNITLIHLTSDVLSWVGGKGQSASVCARKAAFILGHPQRALAHWSRESNYTHATAFNTQIPPVFHFVNNKSTRDGVMKKQRASSML